MELRQKAGELVNQTYYQGQSFLVKRAGQVMVAIIPASEYREVQRIKQESRDRFFATTDEVRQRVSKSGVSDKELQNDIDEAVAESRKA